MGNPKLVMLIPNSRYGVSGLDVLIMEQPEGEKIQETGNSFCFIGQAVSHLKGLKTIPLADWIYRITYWKSLKMEVRHAGCYILKNDGLYSKYHATEP